MLVLASCAPAIRVREASSLSPRGVSGKGVDVCVLVQERRERRRYEGVRELSFEPWHSVIASVVIRHPAGLVVLDPAFGRNIERDLAHAPKYFALMMGPARDKRPMVDVMVEAGIDPLDVSFALATHAHWDHIGALGELPNAKVLFSRQELEWARRLSGFLDQGVMPHHFMRARQRLAYFEFKGPPRDGFPSSFDLFGDGAIVAVPLPGHTPGSTAYFVTLADGRELLFVGDTSWTARGIEGPVHKLVPVDGDLARTGDALGHLHALQLARPELLIVPAHEGIAIDRLPLCGASK